MRAYLVFESAPVYSAPRLRAVVATLKEAKKAARQWRAYHQNHTEVWVERWCG